MRVPVYIVLCGEEMVPIAIGVEKEIVEHVMAETIEGIEIQIPFLGKVVGEQAKAYIDSMRLAEGILEIDEYA